MEKVKSLCSKCGAWVKSHVAIVAIIVVVVIVAIVLVSFVGGSEKRAVKKYLSALNSYDSEKIVKAMDVEAAVAWNSVSYTSDDIIEDFEDALEDVDDDTIEAYEDSLDEQYDKDDKGKRKVKLEKVIYVTKAKDNKDVKKVVCKVQVTSKPDEDDDDDEDDVWAKTKTFTRTYDTYATFYLYKNKVIYATI